MFTKNHVFRELEGHEDPSVSSTKGCYLQSSHMVSQAALWKTRPQVIYGLTTICDLFKDSYLERHWKRKVYYLKVTKLSFLTSEKHSESKEKKKPNLLYEGMKHKNTQFRK